MQTRMVAGRYELMRELGRGGMGTVWLGKDHLTMRPVAVKELRAPDGTSAEDREVFEKRSLREGRNAARIQHPNAVTLYDVVPPSAGDDAVYLVMEYVEGMTLAQEIERNGGLSKKRVTAITVQLLSVLDAAHGLGVIHRDIKPLNIMITKAGQAKLADFGIAHAVGDTRLTGSGLIGTPSYMAPELFEARPVTAAADLWSLGTTLYHALEGRAPFERESTAATLRAVLMDPVPAVHTAGPLATAITGMLTRDPTRRLTVRQARHLLEAAEAPAHPATGTATLPAGRVLPAAQRQQDPGGRALKELAGSTSRLSLRGPSRRAFMKGRPRLADWGTTRFTSMPNGLMHLTWWAVGTGGLSILLSLAIQASKRPQWDTVGNVLLIAGFGVAFIGEIAQVISTHKHPTLAIGPRGITVISSRYRALPIRWDEVTRIGPIAENGRTRLYAYARDLSRNKPLVELSPLGSPHYPPSEIRTAILKHYPDAVIDPM